MAGDAESVRVILRSLAEIRDGALYGLWVDPALHRGRTLPQIGFRIFQVADSTDAFVVVAGTVEVSDDAG